jgi:two-component system, NtrC family, nitrogen regulation sensor histidine kinase NtrY
VKFIERHLFLLLALLAFSLSALYYAAFERQAPGATDEQYVATVQQRVKAEMKVSADELGQVCDRLRVSRDERFSRLLIETRYPYFVCRNRKLIFWSDHRFVPPASALLEVAKPRLARFEQGRYIVSRQTLRRGRDTLDVFSLINVYRGYTNTNAYLRSGYNPDLFALEPVRIETVKLLDYQNVYDNRPGFLFSVVPPPITVFRNRHTPVNTVILASLGMLFLGVYVVRQTTLLRRKRRFGAGFGVLAAYLLVLRTVMLYFGMPFLFFENDLFNPRYYAASGLAPSLGDLLLNVLVTGILAFYWVNNYYRSQTFFYLWHRPLWVRLLLAVGCVVVSYAVFAWCFAELNNIYEKSQYTLTITLAIRFSGLKVASLVVFIALSLVYFLLLHLLVSLFMRLMEVAGPGYWRGVARGAGCLVVGTLLAVPLLWGLGLGPEPIMLLNFAYFLALYLSRLPRVLYTFRYQTSIYLFMGAFACATMAASVVYTQEIRRDLVRKHEYGAQVLAENDELGEILLGKAQLAIAADSEIVRFFAADTLLLRERVQELAKNEYLGKYLERYDTEVLSFRASGQSLDESQPLMTLADLTARYRRPAYRTANPDIYFLNDPNAEFIKQYIGFITVRQAALPGSGPGRVIGHIVLDMKLRDQSARIIYPELAVDDSFSRTPEINTYSYAIVSPARRITYSTGSFNYERNMPAGLLTNPALFDDGVLLDGVKHVGLRGRNGRLVVVSSPAYGVSDFFANFSFLYLLLVLTVIGVILSYAIQFGFSRFSLNYSTRIQILLNVSFFLPLLLMVVIILSVISANYASNQEATFVSNTKNIAATFLPVLEEMKNGRRSYGNMELELRKIAVSADINVSVFNVRGELVTTTRPVAYEGGQLSKFINPKAYIHLIEERENQLLLSESVGNRYYTTVYVTLKDAYGRMQGIQSVSYFNAGEQLNRQLVDVVASALSIFTALFLVFLVVSYFASSVLTKPLELLTQQIRKTNLDKLNEPVKWRSDDEIGLLIKEYNRMLVKLDESKRALSHSEKQSAWRDMAKQVAHEIKNPLTPMKLTLQHLQRTLPNATADNPKLIKLMQRTFDTLLDQIDNLNAVATSFSDFAKMPLPKNELFEITNVLTRTADLYAQKVEFRRDIEPGPVRVMGDRHLFGRIITNLILNAIQSVPLGRKPSLELKLNTTADEIQLEIHDNGAGIPENIRSKVFLPNFTTKEGGTGLGLAIAKHGIEHAGGNIWFETEEGSGTSFFVTLPLAHSEN